MPWDWTTLIETLPEEKRPYFESLHIQTETFPALAKSEKKAFLIDQTQMRIVFLKAFEEYFHEDSFSYFTKRLKEFERICARNQTLPNGSMYVYFTGTYLYLLDGETKQFLCRFRIPLRNP